jgi:DNA-directed RNA polymerase subunit RPC12/RpoP
MNIAHALEGPACSYCSAASAIAARSRTIHRGQNRTAVLAFVWRCQRCGHEFVDQSLARAVGVGRCGIPASRRAPGAPRRPAHTQLELASAGGAGERGDGA